MLSCNDRFITNVITNFITNFLIELKGIVTTIELSLN